MHYVHDAAKLYASTLAHNLISRHPIHNNYAHTFKSATLHIRSVDLNFATNTGPVHRILPTSINQRTTGAVDEHQTLAAAAARRAVSAPSPALTAVRTGVSSAIEATQ